MRDIVLRNLTSANKKRRIMTSCETINQNGVETRINRNFIYRVSEKQRLESDNVPAPKIYIYKNSDSKNQQSKFSYKVKGSMYLVNEEKVYLVNYLHSFRLNLLPSV
ncbi:MAG: hypothetical protein P9L96_00890 [Candidatus Gygaella obscura]|nr:hypothetical protein [Candidatus Gygaella obscura]